MVSFSRRSEVVALAPDGSASNLSGWIRRLGRQIAVCASTCADYAAAARAYEQMRGLSDAELQRRGLSRATLARDLCAATDRSS